METETTTRIHNLIILDRSGSMCSIRDAAVSHLNECLQAIKSAQKEFVGQKHSVSSHRYFQPHAQILVYQLRP